MCFFAWWPCELLGPLGLQSDRWWGNEIWGAGPTGLLGTQNIFDRNAFLLRWFNQTFNFEFSFRSEERGAQGGPEPVWSDQSWAAIFTSSSSWWSSPSSSATMSTELTLMKLQWLWNGGSEENRIFKEEGNWIYNICCPAAFDTLLSKLWKVFRENRNDMILRMEFSFTLYAMALSHQKLGVLI